MPKYPEQRRKKKGPRCLPDANLLSNSVGLMFYLFLFIVKRSTHASLFSIIHTLVTADLPLNWIVKSGSDQQKIGIWGEKSGSRSNRLQKEITHPKSRLFVVSFFYSAIRNVLNCQSSPYVFFSCLFLSVYVLFCFYVCSLRPASSWLSFLT